MMTAKELVDAADGAGLEWGLDSNGVVWWRGDNRAIARLEPHLIANFLNVEAIIVARCKEEGLLEAEAWARGARGRA